MTRAGMGRVLSDKDCKYCRMLNTESRGVLTSDTKQAQPRIQITEPAHRDAAGLRSRQEGNKSGQISSGSAKSMYSHRHSCKVVKTRTRGKRLSKTRTNP